MTIKGKEIVATVLARVLDEYSLGDTTSSDVRISIYDLTYDYIVPESKLEKTFENLKQNNLLCSWLDAGDSFVLFVNDNFLFNGKNYLEILTKDDDSAEFTKTNEYEFVIDKDVLKTIEDNPKGGSFGVGRPDLL